MRSLNFVCIDRQDVGITDGNGIETYKGIQICRSNPGKQARNSR